MKRTLPQDSLQEIATKLELAHKALQRRYPGMSAERRPVHVVYGGAHLFRSGTTRRLGDLAQKSLDEYAPDFASFAKAVGLSGSDRLPSAPDAIAGITKAVENDPQAAKRENPPAWLAHTVYRRVREKLRREPIEDFRLDFEDGYGNRPDDEEDGHAASAAAEISAGMNAGELPQHFCITLPKVSLPDEVAALADICSRLEPMLDFEPGALRIEVMVETSQAIFNERGEANLLALAGAARGRCIAAHFGPFDYTSSLGIAAPRNAGAHPASDFARSVMQVALAETGIRVADGPLNILPIPPHRAATHGVLTARQVDENRATLHDGWKLQYEHVRRALENGFYQGWDLHPAQLPARFAAVYSFFLENLDSSAERLRNFLEKAAQATRIGHVFDDAAMVQGFLNFFLQAIHCGAATAEEVEKMTGLTQEELRVGSFVQILARRK